MRLIVEPNALGGWDVREVNGLAEPLFRGRRAEAERRAQQLCGAHGGSVRVIGPNKVVLAEYAVEAAPEVDADEVVEVQPATHVVPTAKSESESLVVAGVESVADQPDTLLVKGLGLALNGAAKAGLPQAQTIKTEGKRVNMFLTVVLGLGLFSSSWISAEVSSLGNSWPGVFVATLTWSLGVAASTYLIRTGVLVGANVINAAALLFVLAGLLAAYVGKGTLEVPPHSGGISAISAYATAAVTTYGLVGTLISGSIGCWLGWQLAAPTQR